MKIFPVGDAGELRDRPAEVEHDDGLGENKSRLGSGRWIVACVYSPVLRASGILTCSLERGPSVIM